MCGFFAVYCPSGGVASNRKAIVDAGRTLKHRGPDDEGDYFDENFGVHFQRLSIIDPGRSGHQPMMSANGRFIMVFNGEIYNYRQLRKQLLALGHIFSGESDSEVLLAAFVEWGADCVDQLRGMFAFLVWDKADQILHAFRDRLGIKPLYLCRDGDSFLFASEIKAILKFSPITAEPNERAIFKFLARGWVDDTEETFYADITSMLPGTAIRIKKGIEASHRYWAPVMEGDLPCNPDKFLDEFSNTISLHLQADVPLATTLSGGMDSTSITALAAREAEMPEDIQSFSVIPPETVDESLWIDCTVEKTGISHAYLQPDWERITAVFDAVLLAHDEPFQSSSCIYQYLLRREVANHGIKVLLVGEGGDEVLGGYRRLLLPYLYALEKDGRNDLFEQALDGAKLFFGIDREALQSQLTAYNRMLAEKESGQENISAYGLLDDDFIARHSDLVNEPAYPVPDTKEGNRFFAHLKAHLLRRDIPYVLRMEDRNSMAYGIEARVPFLDHCFMEQVHACDYAEFMRGGVNKSMLRRAMVSVLPDEVTGRQDKSPRPGSNVHLIYDVLLESVREMLSSRIFLESPWWRSDCTEKFEQDRKSRNAQRAEVWFRLYSVFRWRVLLLNDGY